MQLFVNSDGRDLIQKKILVELRDRDLNGCTPYLGARDYTVTFSGKRTPFAQFAQFVIK